MKQACLLLICWFGLVTSGFAGESGHTIVSLAGGGYTLDDGTHHLKGSRTAIGLKHRYGKTWSWFAALQSGSAQEKFRAPNQSNYLLTANTSGLSGGVEAHFAVNKRGTVEPFVGLGLTALNYQLDFTYPNSKVGQVKGTGFGPLARVGSRFRFGKNFIFIPAYVYNSIQIKTVSGSTENLVFTGLYFGLIASF